MRSWRKKGRSYFHGGAIFQIFEQPQFVRRVHVTRRDGKQTGAIRPRESCIRLALVPAPRRDFLPSGTEGDYASPIPWTTDLPP
jgi:hypothetical protein